MDMKLNREALASKAVAELTTDLQQALLNDPSRVVLAPGFKGTNTAADVVLDSFSATSGTQSLLDLLGIVGAAARGDDVVTRAALWISVQAATHAKFHADDLVRQTLEGGE